MPAMIFADGDADQDIAARAERLFALLRARPEQLLVSVAARVQDGQLMFEEVRHPRQGFNWLGLCDLAIQGNIPVRELAAALAFAAETPGVIVTTNSTSEAQ